MAATLWLTFLAGVSCGHFVHAPHTFLPMAFVVLHTAVLKGENFDLKGKPLIPER